MDFNLNRSLEDILLPLAGLFAVFVLPVCAFVFFRVLAHRERMAMIRNGIAPTAAHRRASATPSAFDPTAPTEPVQLTLNKGIRLGLIGFALTLGLAFATFHSSESGASWYPGPWLLLGLVPMFIGIAQVLIAVLSGASLGALTSRKPVEPQANAPFVSPASGPPATAPPAIVTPPATIPEPFDSPGKF